MSTLSLSLQEAIARDRIDERVAARHHVPRQTGRTRRHVRAALLLRGLAERLDPTAGRQATTEQHLPPALPAPHAGSPRPWTAAPRRAPHRHS